jgi:hypothetical protein
MLTFLPGFSAFAVAGLVAASVPVLIHLLNRRRFKVTEWAAMQFLRDAVRRNRRLLKLRDIILLILRTVALAVIGLALARPFFAGNSAQLSPNQPLHAVVVVDNSQSMGYQRLDGSPLLDEAKTRVKEFVEALPDGSLVSLIPLCGNPGGFSTEAYRTKQDARDALEQIQVVDRYGSAVQALDLAAAACQTHTEMPTKRVIFIGDQQKSAWLGDSFVAQLKKIPDLQVVAVTPDEIENTWIADFRLQDGIADLDTPALFTTIIRHEGPTSRKAVEVRLNINGSDVDSKVVDLEPGQSREITFNYRFDIPLEEGRPTYVPAQISIPHDRRRFDDARFLLVPVMSAVPVLFIDQYGPEESPQKNRFGETYALRRLMTSTSGDGGRQLLQAQHLRIEQVDRKALERARLVVLAGVNDPGPAVTALREFVEQGGQLFIAAGGDFDPAVWTRNGWQDGAGILPVPLADLPHGQTPEEAKDLLQPFFLAYSSMAHDYFHLADTSNEQLQDLYRRPIFFKSVQPEVSDEVLAKLLLSDTARIEEQRNRMAAVQSQLKKWSDQEARGALSDADRQQRTQDEKRLASLRPSWLLWKAQESVDGRKAAEVARSQKPRVLATYDDHKPFMIQRALGQGQILFMTTGISSNWNTLPRENAILLFNRILRSMVESTLPKRTLTTDDPLVLPITDRHALYQIVHPEGRKESLTVDALGSDQFGVNIRPLAQRGIYRVIASRAQSLGADVGSDSFLEIPLAVNGPEQESDPAVLDEAHLRDRIGASSSFRWVGRGETIRLEGGQISGQDLWKWLLGVVLVCLLAEMLVLAWPMLGRERAA